MIWEHPPKITRGGSFWLPILIILYVSINLDMTPTSVSKTDAPNSPQYLLGRSFEVFLGVSLGPRGLTSIWGFPQELPGDTRGLLWGNRQ